MNEKPKLEVVYMSREELAAKGHPQNFRRHPDSQREAVSESIKEFNWVVPLIYNVRTGRVLDGHLRAALPSDVVGDKVPVSVVDWDETKEKRFLASFDRTVAMAEIDEPALAELLQEIERTSGDLPPGYEETDLKSLIAKIEADKPAPTIDEATADDVPESAPARAHAGDVWRLGVHKLLIGDVMECLRDLPDESVQCVITSPPYWGLRDYSVEGQLGLEKTPEEHVERMVEVFREVRRVLRKDGTLWLNYGDCYYGGSGANKDDRFVKAHRTERPGRDDPPRKDLKAKDLVGVPWQVAIALRSDGWWLRSDIIWHKPNPMPSSVADRPTPSHEHVFLLAKSARYFYDADAVKEESKTDHFGLPGHKADGDGMKGDWRFKGDPAGIPGGFRNLRDVWTLTTRPLSEAHFATFPEKLVEPCINAGTSAKGGCTKCGAPVKRDVVASGGTIGEAWCDHIDDKIKGARIQDRKAADGTYKRETVGWTATCDCAQAVGPCVVLDPFGGAGTTMIVAEKLGRAAICIELNPKYADIAIKRWETLTKGTATPES